ncbi:MAG: hypothetical protein LBJ74_02755 [Heliobacteriaceae bacterium]|nr:hypothetical protein [Heliobacteriaceae bacterium]
MKKILLSLISLQLVLAPCFAFEDSPEPENVLMQEVQPAEFTVAPPPLVLPEYDPMNREKTLYGSVVNVPAGTPIQVTFDSGISSGSVEKNDRILAVLTENWVYKGTILAPRGSLVYGAATNARSATYAYGDGTIEISFNQIMPESGNPIEIRTEKIYIKSDGSRRALKMTRDVAVGTALGVLTGLVFSALSGGTDLGHSMLIYGSMGAAGGGLTGAVRKGEDVWIPNGTNFELKLLEPVSVEPYM